MDLYGRAIPAIATTDKLPIYDASGTTDEEQLRDVTVANLQKHLFRLVTIAGTSPTTDELPASTCGFLLGSDSAIKLWCRNAGGTLVSVTLA